MVCSCGCWSKYHRWRFLRASFFNDDNLSKWKSGIIQVDNHYGHNSKMSLEILPRVHSLCWWDVCLFLIFTLLDDWTSFIAPLELQPAVTPVQLKNFLRRYLIELKNLESSSAVSSLTALSATVSTKEGKSQSSNPFPECSYCQRKCRLSSACCGKQLNYQLKEIDALKQEPQIFQVFQGSSTIWFQFWQHWWQKTFRKSSFYLNESCWVSAGFTEICYTFDWFSGLKRW